MKRRMTRPIISVLAIACLVNTAKVTAENDDLTRLKQSIKSLHDVDPDKRAAAAREMFFYGGMAVRPLMEVLKSQDKNARIAAALGLESLGPRSRPAVPLLIGMLSAKDKEERKQAITALGKVKRAAAPAVPRLIEVLSWDDEADVRVAAIAALDLLGSSDKNVVPALMSALKDDNENVRSAAVDALADFKGPEARRAVPELLRLLMDESLDVRVNAMHALGTIKPVEPHVIAVLVEKLADADASVGSYAAESLKIVGRPAESAVLKALERGRATTRIRACDLLSLDGQATWGPKVLPALARALKDPEDAVRKSAAYALLNRDDKVKPVLPLLVPVLKDSNKEVRAVIAVILAKYSSDPGEALSVAVELLAESESNEVIFALAMMSLGQADPVHVPFLRKSLGHSKENVRLTVIHVLGHAGTAGIPVIIEAFKNPDVKVRQAAVGIPLGLPDVRLEGGLAERMVVPAYVAALRDSDKDVRVCAVAGLGRAAANAAAAVPALIQAMDDQELAVRKGTILALGRIGAAAKPALPRLIKELENAPADRPTAKQIADLIADVDSDSFSTRSKSTQELERLGRLAVLPLRQALAKNPSLEGRRRLSALLTKLDTQEAELGVAAVGALEGLGPQARGAISALVAAVRDKTRLHDIRTGAVAALGAIDAQDPTVFSILTAALRDEDKGVRCAAAEVFSRSRDAARNAKAELIRAMKDENIRVGVFAVSALARLGSDGADAVPALTDLIRSKGEMARHAVEALRRVGPTAKQAIPTLIELLEGAGRKRCSDAGAAAETLGQFGSDSRPAVPALIKLLPSSDDGTAAIARTALAKIDPEWMKIATPILLNEAKANYRWERNAVIHELAKLGPNAKEAIPHLVPLLKDVDDDVRLAAVKTLAAIGPAAAATAPNLRPLLDDDSDIVCEAAAAALKQIDPKSRANSPR
jgi:HEAT repeat protein